MKLRTEYAFPPIPIRSMDWRAYDADTYCGCPECAPKQIIGQGATEQQAIDNFMERLADETAE